MSVIIAAEIGMAHDGDPSRVAVYATAANACGCDVLKLQAHHPDESSPLEEWRVPPASGETRLAYWTRTTWDRETWREVGRTIHAHGLQFACSMFSRTMIQMFYDIPELDFWKVPSGLVSDPVAIQMIQNDPLKRPSWWSNGLHVDDMEEFPIGIAMACTSLYPCPPHFMNLAGVWGGDEPWDQGWSDHTGDPALIYAAVGRHAQVVEVHFELGTEQTPDTSAAWTPVRLTELITGIRRIESALNADYEKIQKAVEPLRKFYVYTEHEGRVAKWGGKGKAL